MRIETFLRKMVWMVFLTSCVSMPAQTNGINSHSITPSVTISPVPTATIFSTPVLTAPFPLLPTERTTTIKELMTRNASCKLPCFWEITPGVTDWESAANLLQSIGAAIGNTEVSPGTNYHSVVFKDENLTVGDSFGFLESSNVVNLILARGNLHGSTGRNMGDFSSLWASYSPRKVIRDFGIPSRILLSSMFAIEYGDTGRRGYILWVFYDHLGFMIRYDGTVADLPMYHMCPQLQDGGDITRIDLILQNPSNSSPLELHDSILANSVVPRVILPIEDAAGIDTEEFYNLFVKEDRQSCFDSPREIWKIN